MVVWFEIKYVEYFKVNDKFKHGNLFQWISWLQEYFLTFLGKLFCRGTCNNQTFLATYNKTYGTNTSSVLHTEIHLIGLLRSFGRFKAHEKSYISVLSAPNFVHSEFRPQWSKNTCRTKYKPHLLANFLTTAKNEERIKPQRLKSWPN